MLSPIRFAHSSTSLTVPEQSRREGRLFACHSERSEESLSFRAQGRLREATRTALKSRKGILRCAQNDNGRQNGNIRQFFISLLEKLTTLSHQTCFVTLRLESCEIKGRSLRDRDCAIRSVAVLRMRGFPDQHGFLARRASGVVAPHAEAADDSMARDEIGDRVLGDRGAHSSRG